jgi:sugar phosphate isomerase/epimerase
VPTEVVLSTASFFPDTELAFRVAAECGYDGVEVMVNHDRYSQSPEAVQALAKGYGVRIRAVHVPCLVVSQHVWGWNPEVKLRRTVEMATAVGAGVVVVHPPFRWQRGYADDFRDLVVQLDTDGGGRAGPRVTVENMFTVEAMGRRVDPYRWNDDPAFAPFPALTLDTSHAGAARQNLLELHDSMGGRVLHVHLSDSTATRGDEHLPPGKGVLPLTELASAMVGRGFGGVVVIEVGFGRLPEGSRTAAARDSLEYARIAFAP